VAEEYKRQWIKSTFPHGEMSFAAVPKLDDDGEPVTDREGNVVMLPGVVLPKGRYQAHEVDAGKRSHVEITPMQRERLMQDEIFRGLLKSGHYEFVDLIPDTDKTAMDQLLDARSQIVELQEQLEGATDTKAIEELTTRIGEKEKALDNLTQAVADAQKEASAAKDQLSEKDQEIADLQKQLADLQKKKKTSAGDSPADSATGGGGE
jgi:uncharacterized coiled-coil protein SlyX